MPLYKKPIAFIDAPRATQYWGKEMQGRIENEPVIDHLIKLGVNVDTVAWYEQNDWEKYSHLILRTPSDLYFHLEEFKHWLDAVSQLVPVLNNPEVILWNMDKHYLSHLSELGINIAPTTFVEVGETFTMPNTEFVIKPVSSGGGANSGRFFPTEYEKANKLISQIHAMGMAAIIQPYLKSIDERGEVDLIFYNEKFDHAIIKGPVLKKESDGEIPTVQHPNPQAYTPSEEELTLAKKAIRATPRKDRLLYARVDMATDNHGRASIMELEYLDPVLFHNISEGSPGRFAQAIVSYLNGNVSRTSSANEKFEIFLAQASQWLSEEQIEDDLRISWRCDCECNAVETLALLLDDLDDIDDNLEAQLLRLQSIEWLAELCSSPVHTIVPGREEDISSRSINLSGENISKSGNRIARAITKLMNKLFK